MISCCPRCSSYNIKKNGHAVSGKQQYHCNNCGGGFVDNPSSNRISEDDKEKIKRELIERNSLRGICRVFLVSLTWLLNFAVDLYNNVPSDLGLKLPGGVKLDVQVIKAEADEIWSFVGSKDNQAWIWLVLDRETRQVIAFHVGGRKQSDAKKLWKKVPAYLKTGMTVYTDFLASYKAAIPESQHIASGKDAGNTNHIERLNCTIRQRVSRLVRSSLSFSKKMENHIGAIGYFLFNYNKEIQAKLT